MDYKKPQSTLVQGGMGIYPLTTADQVILADGSRLEKDGRISADSAANSAKLGGKAPEYYLQPRNLLDNSDFRNPVNQRGQTNYTLSAWGGYCIDRWRVGSVSTTLMVNHNDCTLSGEIYQTIDLNSNGKNLNGKTVTIAAKVNGSVTCKSGNIAMAGEWAEFAAFPIQGGRVYIYADSNNLHFGMMTDGTVTIEWAALYEGAYTADTLPPYVPKGYAAELAECLRYFELLNNGSSQFVRAYNSSYIAFMINYAEKRIDPTISVTGSLTNALSVAGVGTSTPTSIGSAYPVGRKSARINAEGTFDTSYTYSIIYNVANIAISADL